MEKKGLRPTYHVLLPLGEDAILRHVPEYSDERKAKNVPPFSAPHVLLFAIYSFLDDRNQLICQISENE